MMHFIKTAAMILALMLMIGMLAGCAPQTADNTQGQTQSTIPSTKPTEPTVPDDTNPEVNEPILNEYIWDVTVVYENGAAGTYTFINAGLEDWADQFDPKYLQQTFVVTPESNTFAMPIMDPSVWIVDNTRDWYQWVIIDENDEGAQITFTVVKGMEYDNYTDHGTLEIHIALP